MALVVVVVVVGGSGWWNWLTASLAVLGIACVASWLEGVPTEKEKKRPASVSDKNQPSCEATTQRTRGFLVVLVVLSVLL